MRIGWVLAVAALVHAGCSSTPTGPSTGASSSAASAPSGSSNPPTAKVELHFDSDGRNTGAIVGFTQIRFDASGSTGDGLTYVLDFGDGIQTTQPVAVHACQTAGVLTARVTVTDRSGLTSVATTRYGCASLVHSQGVQYSLTYGWVSLLSMNPLTHREEFRRLAFEAQNGAAVRGFYTHPEGNQTHFTGTLSGEHSITLRLDDGTIEFRGDVALNEDIQQSGYLSSRHLLVTTHGSSADGIPLDFAFYDPF